jgi:hypothetical protein
VEKEYIRTLKRDAVNALIETLDGYTGYYDDLHNEVFNMDYYMVYTSDAIEFLGNDAFDAIGNIAYYEKIQFGEVITDFSNPCAVVNMMYYIIGEEILHDVMYNIVGNVSVGDDEINNELIETLKDYANNYI